MRVFALSTLLALLATSATAQNLGRTYGDAGCEAFLVARSNPMVVREAALIYYDALFTGAAATSTPTELLQAYRKVCAENEITVVAAMRRAAHSVQ